MDEEEKVAVGPLSKNKYKLMPPMLPALLLANVGFFPRPRLSCWACTQHAFKSKPVEVV